MILVSLINDNHERTDALCQDCAEELIHNGYGIEEKFNSDTQACSECGRKEKVMNRLANIAVSWVVDNDGKGERSSFTKDNMAEEDVTRLHEEYKQLHHDKKLCCLEVHIQYKD